MQSVQPTTITTGATIVNSTPATGNGTGSTGTGSAVATIDYNDPFNSYAQKVGTVGQYLTFKNGEYLAGQNADTVPLKTRMAANVAGLRIGWRRWYGGRLEDDRTVPLAAGERQPTRQELGDTDDTYWEVGNDGKKRDPWVFTNVLELADIESGEQYIFSTSSKGGVGAIGRLCGEYGKQYRQRPGMTPIVELGADSYMHPVYKKTWFPVLKIVDWAGDGAPAGVIAEGDPLDDEIPFATNDARAEPGFRKQAAIV